MSCKAVGVIGIDARKSTDIQKQKRAFEEQVKLSAMDDKTIIITMQNSEFMPHVNAYKIASDIICIQVATYF